MLRNQMWELPVMQPSSRIEFTLLENGLEFIWSAVEHLGDRSSTRSLKHAVLNLASGVELILKERLRRQDWKLVFARPEKADEKAYKRGAFRSIGLDDAVERLESECQIEFKNSQLRRLMALRNKRNRMQHFDMADSVSAIMATTAGALDVVIEFIGQELNQRLTKGEKELLKELRKKLSELETFVSVRKKNIAPRLKNAYAVLPCPTCQQESLIVDDGVECAFCGYKAQGSDAADDYAADVLGVTWLDLRDGAEWPVGLCPSCDWEACVETGDDGSNAYICFHCGQRWALGELNECVRCGRWIKQSDQCSICDACFDEQMRKND